MKSFLCSGLAGLLVACFCITCGDDDNHGSGDVDPRCKTLCAVKEPNSANQQLDICSVESAEQCELDCSARIAGTSTTCTSCQLENAYFLPPHESARDEAKCDASGCYVEGREGKCPVDLQTKKVEYECLREIFPMREIECTPGYRDIAECAALCGGAS